MAEEKRYIADLTARDLGRSVIYESEPSAVIEVSASGTLQEVRHMDGETRIAIGDGASIAATITIIDGFREREIVTLGDPVSDHWGLSR